MVRVVGAVEHVRHSSRRKCPILPAQCSHNIALITSNVRRCAGTHEMSLKASTRALGPESSTTRPRGARVPIWFSAFAPTMIASLLEPQASDIQFTPPQHPTFAIGLRTTPRLSLQYIKSGWVRSPLLRLADHGPFVYRLLLQRPVILGAVLDSGRTFTRAAAGGRIHCGAERLLTCEIE